MKVLLSIKPEFASRIFDGSKKYEYRRIIFKRKEVETVVVYASNPIRRVIGEFDIGEILHEEPERLWTQTCSHAGITKTRFMEYFGDLAKGYAIKIGRVRKYQTPLSLDELMISPPPQSFRYLYTARDYFYDTAKNLLSENIPLPTLL